MSVTVSPGEDLDAEVGIVELRQNLGQLVDLAYHRGVVTTVLRNRRRVAVLISAELYDRLNAIALGSDTAGR